MSIWDALSGNASQSQYGIQGNAFQYGGHQGGAQQQQTLLQNQANNALNQQAPQANYAQANQDYAQQQGVNTAQGAYGNYLQGIMTGANGPSVAERQMQVGTDQSIAAQNAMAHSARGGGPQLAAAQTQAAQQAGQMQTQNVQSAGILRAQEQTTARQQYQDLLSGQRQQDLMAQGLSAQQAQFQASAELQQEGIGNQMALGSEGLSNQIGMAQLQAQMGQQGMQLGQSEFNAQQQNQANANALGAVTGMIGAGLGAAGMAASGGATAAIPAAAGAAGAASDENVKKNVREEGIAAGARIALQQAATAPEAVRPEDVRLSVPGGDQVRHGEGRFGNTLSFNEWVPGPDGRPVLAGAHPGGYTPMSPTKAGYPASTPPMAGHHLSRDMDADRGVPVMTIEPSPNVGPMAGTAQVPSLAGMPSFGAPQQVAQGPVRPIPIPATAAGMQLPPALLQSDYEVKQNIRTGSDDERMQPNGEGVKSFLEPIRPVSYDYTFPERDGQGRQYGVMAQDLEKSPMGASMVMHTNQGRMVDTRKASMAALASAADLHHRLARIEARRY